MTTQRPSAFSEQRLTRRSAVRAGGAGAAAMLGSAATPRAAAQDATPTAGQEAAPMRQLLSDNPMWEAFGNRALVLAIDRGADCGECVTTPVAKNIACPTFLSQAMEDPVADYAPDLCGHHAPKVLVQFTMAEGAGMHTEALARTLYAQRMFDWLDETLDMAD